MNFIHTCLWFMAILYVPLCEALNLILFHNDTISTAAFKILQESQVLSSYEKYSATNNEEILSLLNSLEGPTILIDLVDDIVNHYYLSQLCEKQKSLHIIIEDNLDYLTEWTFSGSSSRGNYLQALKKLFGYFNWTQGIIFNSIQNSFIKDYLLNFSSDFRSVTIEPNSNINDIVGRIAVPLGSTMYYIFGDEIDSSAIQNALIDKKLATTGNGIILGKESYFDAITEGSLIISEENQEGTVSKEIYISNAILQIFSIIEASSVSVEDFYELKNALEKSCLYHFCQNTFSLVNYYGGSRIIVGNFSPSSIYITQKITFPGNTTTPPVSDKKTLPISINAGTTNYGLASFATLPIYARGTSMAVKMVNKGLGILENFQMSLFVYDCGATFYDSTYGYKCFLKDIDKFGLGAVSSYTSGVTMGTLKTFKLLNISVPIIGAVTSSSALNSTSTYPWFSRVQVSDSNLASQMPNLLKALGWQSFAVLYQNETWGISSYLALKQVADDAGLNIVNAAAIPPGLTRDGIGNYTNILQEILDSNARLVVEFMYDDLLGVALEKFYDLGARNGDLIFFSAISAALIDIGAKNDTYRYKRLAIGCPMLVFQGPVWMGTLGKNIYNNLKNDYQTTPSDLSCNFFDSAFLIANAIDFMINRGQDYTDGYKLNYTIRNIKISGCSGTLAISQGSNDREMDSMSIDSNQVINNVLVVYHIGLYSPYSTQYLSIAQPFYYDNQETTIKPADLRNQNGNCPFPDSQIRTFYDGRYLVFGICFSIALVTSIITFYIWKRWWNVKIEEMKAKEEISLQDFIVGATIAIEFFQFASMGPDYGSINSFLSGIGEALSLNLGNFVKLSNGVFWAICDTILGLSITWIILCFTVFYRLDEKYNHMFIFRSLGQLADYLMPVLGNLCFIPFVSVLLDVFVCDESIGNHFTDSFLSKDCYQFCWKGDHVIYAILSGIAILTYEPLAVFCRPLWQEFQSVLHVKTLPMFLMVKTIIQITLIVMNKTVKRAEATTHGFLFLLVLLIYVIFIFRNKPYNYPRFSWWQGVSIIGVMWLGLMTTIDILASSSGFPWISLVVGGWAIIIFVGVYVQKKKYPSLLFRQKGKDTSTLFKFAFQFGNSSKIRVKEINRFSSSKVIPSTLTIHN